MSNPCYLDLHLEQHSIGLGQTLLRLLWVWPTADDIPGTFDHILCWLAPGVGTPGKPHHCQLHLWGGESPASSQESDAAFSSHFPLTLGSLQHPVHNLPPVLFVHSHDVGGGHSPTLKGLHAPSPSPQGKREGPLLLPLGRPPPSSVSPILNTGTSVHPYAALSSHKHQRMQVGLMPIYLGPSACVQFHAYSCSCGLPPPLLGPPHAQCPWGRL